MLENTSSHINLSQLEDGVQQQIEKLESHASELQRQVSHLQRLSSLGTISAMLAHEFNNILTPIVSYAQYALQREDPALMRTTVEKTLKHAGRLTTLCHRVLGMAVDDRMGPAAVSIRNVATEAVECLGRSLEKDDITLRIEVPPDLMVRAHANSLQQVFFNLVLNARQAMLDRPGTLTIKGRREGSGPVTVEISDTGPGIRPENLDKIFEAFFSTKQHEGRPDRRGIGLGLSICKQLMEEQGGTITVSSRPGEGTTFTLTLPSADGNEGISQE